MYLWLQADVDEKQSVYKQVNSLLFSWCLTKEAGKNPWTKRRWAVYAQLHTVHQTPGCSSFFRMIFPQSEFVRKHEIQLQNSDLGKQPYVRHDCQHFRQPFQEKADIQKPLIKKILCCLSRKTFVPRSDLTVTLKTVCFRTWLLPSRIFALSKRIPRDKFYLSACTGDRSVYFSL